jgi:hypothetical protein
VHTINTPLQMMHTDITNFTGGNKDKVRGAEVVVWGDAAKVDSVSQSSTQCHIALPRRFRRHCNPLLQQQT